MRPAGRVRMGFFPLPLTEAQRIRRFLLFPNLSVSALDPCVGDGVAFAAITVDPGVLRYGIEIDAYRAEQAREQVATVVRGNALETHCSVDSFSLLYLNPPYDWELGSGQNRRMEQVFLSHTYRWLKAGGIPVLVIGALATFATAWPRVFPSSTRCRMTDTTMESPTGRKRR